MKRLACMVTIGVFFSCTHRPGLEMITVAENRCGVSCDGSATEIRSDLSYHYYGGYAADVQGNYKGKFNKKSWDEFAHELEKIDIDTLRSDYSVGFDEWFAEIVIHQNGKVKHIIGDSHLPKTLLPNVLSILKSYQTTHLIKTPKTYPFETTFQKPANFVKPRFPPTKL